ncbi:MAG: DUF2934 domain-containing protein [Gammaproteobacteria bacterium]
MSLNHAPLPLGDRFAAIAGDRPGDAPGLHTLATRDHASIRRWASVHKAEPATGEATASGPAVRDVNDGGVGIRFNFPGCGRFRPITWEEWLAHFDREALLFVYEEEDPSQVAERAHARWQARGGEAGHDREDWFEAERELQQKAGRGLSSMDYRIVKDPGAD